MEDLYLELPESQFERCIESKEDMITIAQRLVPTLILSQKRHRT